MNVDLYYKLELRDKDGKLLNRPRMKRADSYVQGFVSYLYSHLAADESYLALDARGTLTHPRSPSDANDYDGRMDGNASQSLWSRGLVFGHGDTAVTISDSKLGTIAISGTLAGQLVYQGVTFSTTNTVGAKLSYTISRSATNQTGVAMTIKEIGGHARAGVAQSGWWLYWRDLATLEIGDGESATLVYEESITV